MKESSSEEGEDRFEPLFNIHKTFCHSDLIFYLSLHNSVTQKIFLSKKNVGAFAPPHSPLQVMPMPIINNKR